MTILVLGGTGKVGAHLVRLLLEQGQTVRVLVQHPDRVALVPPAAQACVTDIVGDPADAREVFKGIDSVFMLNAPTLNETVEGLMVVAMAKKAGVGRFVYQSSHSLGRLHKIPHLGSKLAIQEAVKSSGMSHTIISPNHFFQNDEFSRHALLHDGVYLNPMGTVGCWRADVRDIAEVAAIALTTEGHDGQNYAVSGPRNLTGPECSDVWSRTLGRPIHYETDIGKWLDVLRPYAASWVIEGLGALYETIVQFGMLGNSEELDILTKLLGRPPRRYEDYVAECAVEWQGELLSHETGIASA
ncbi:NmrA-like family protein (plasmid) [Rhizobium phaseoli]|uniref:SDR family oxidoreductase n=1 Tax=Rhizobium phaseoli TaxID=396 RepID=UPI0007EBE4B2|nr:NmrA family NAD(P)-binding protein [Rhizobium phaseoli]ANL51058.1 NmrA-like family protein [Rhizobium phaseoli]